nr:src substrate cortactin-like isoform X2 [Cavia porcellus]
MSSISSRQKQHKGNQMEILCNLIYASLIKNDVSKKEQRWGSKTLQGSRHQEHINIYKIRENVFQEHHTLKEKELQTGPKASHGYGGKFCVEQYSMDKEQAKAKKKTSTESPTPHPAEERQPSSPIYEKRTPMTSMRTTWASQPSHSRTTRLDRTPDLVLAKQVLTPLRYIPALSVCYFCGIGHYHLPIHTTPVAVDDCEAL